MRLRDAFSLLQPQAPTYAALRSARDTFLAMYPDPRIQALGHEAHAKLIEMDVYWFVDFERYCEQQPDTPIIDQIQAILQRCDALGIAPVRSGCSLTVADVNGAGPALKNAGFRHVKKGDVWRWGPDRGVL